MFQQYSLFPWKTVKDNVAFGPKVAGKTQRRPRPSPALSRYGRTIAFRQALSGRIVRRHAAARRHRRALANYPRVLLMDEPFGALDAQTRQMMQENLLSIWSEFGTTVLFITHDIDEAIFLADRVLIMSAGPGRIIAEFAVDSAAAADARSDSRAGIRRAEASVYRARSHREPQGFRATESLSRPKACDEVLPPMLRPQ